MSNLVQPEQKQVGHCKPLIYKTFFAFVQLSNLPCARPHAYARVYVGPLNYSKMVRQVRQLGMLLI